jgi:hypothetical protein
VRAPQRLWQRMKRKRECARGEETLNLKVGRVLQLSDFAPASNGGNSDTNILGLRVYGEPDLFLVFRSAESNR